jgi:hypothetical protein
MHNAFPMCGIQCIRDLNADSNDLIESEPAALHAVGERLAVDVLHDEERRTVLFADVIQGADIRMRQTRDRSRLAFEALDAFCCQGIGSEELECDDAIEACVAGAVDFAHPARAHLRQNLERADMRAGTESHGPELALSAGIIAPRPGRRRARPPTYLLFECGTEQCLPCLLGTDEERERRIVARAHRLLS